MLKDGFDYPLPVDYDPEEYREGRWPVALRCKCGYWLWVTWLDRKTCQNCGRKWALVGDRFDGEWKEQ